jgi:hypothetical protein
MDTDGHRQNQPHHLSHERNRSHDQQNHDHTHSTEGRNEGEVLDEVLSNLLFYQNLKLMMPFRLFFRSCLFFSLSLGICQEVNEKSEFKSTRTSFLNEYT